MKFSRIGIDFDNTIIIYDEVFYRCAIEYFNMPGDVLADKPSVRDFFWNYPGGKTDWIELQGIVYGERISEAVLAPGLEDFLNQCLEHNIIVNIISHKTKFPGLGPKVNLHSSAWNWLKDKGFLDPNKFGISPNNIFFENPRKKKLERIKSQNCDLFIDDLPEVLKERDFPENVLRLLYDPNGYYSEMQSIVKYSSWESISKFVFEDV